MNARWGVIAAVMMLAGCSEEIDTAKPSVTLIFPADQAQQSTPAAQDQCSYYGKTAKLRGVEAQGAVFECL